MAMATGYDWPALRNFIVSLRYANYTVRLIRGACMTCTAPRRR